MSARGYVWTGAGVAAVVLVAGLVAVGLADDPPEPVSNPARGIVSPYTTPPLRYDWSDE